MESDRDVQLVARVPVVGVTVVVDIHAVSRVATPYGSQPPVAAAACNYIADNPRLLFASYFVSFPPAFQIVDLLAQYSHDLVEAAGCG